MELVIATESLVTSGGSETYLVTLAQELDRLGHAVTITAREHGRMSSSFAERGFAVATASGTLPDRCDAALVLDAPAALDARARWPAAVVVLCAMSEVYDVQMPPRVAGVVDAVVVMSERVAARVRATADAPRCVRLRQPIDTRRFASSGALPTVPRRAVVLSNYVDPGRLEVIRDAFASAGVDCRALGAEVGGIREDPEAVLREVDIVVGKGRAALEGMSCGRAVYLLDYAGRDGWVTAERYAAQEADGFAGQSSSLRFDPREVAGDVAGYDPLMGDVNRDLVLAHHSARVHARDVVGLLTELGATDLDRPGPTPDAAALAELARVARAQWRAERETMTLLGELERRTQAVAQAQARVGDLTWDLERHQAALHATEDRVTALREEAQARARRADELERELGAIRPAPPRRGLRAAASALSLYDRARGR